MFPTPSKRRRFVPPLKGSQTNDNDSSINSSQFSQTQSNCYSNNNITFFSDSLKEPAATSGTANNMPPFTEHSEEKYANMDDTLELMVDNNTEVSSVSAVYQQSVV